jgi:hypothetical protein
LFIFRVIQNGEDGLLADVLAVFETTGKFSSTNSMITITNFCSVSDIVWPYHEAFVDKYRPINLTFAHQFNKTWTDGIQVNIFEQLFILFLGKRNLFHF